jgi:hypothetical protein
VRSKWLKLVGRIVENARLRVCAGTPHFDLKFGQQGVGRPFSAFWGKLESLTSGFTE